MENKLRLVLVLTTLSCVFITNVQAQDYWTQKDSLPALSRFASTAFSIGHYGFVGAGQNGSTYLNDFWRWNQNSNTWTQITTYPTTGYYGMTAFTINGIGYVGLGGKPGNMNSELWAYDTATNAWTKKANFPGTARWGAFVFVIGTNAYIGCGDPGGPPYLQDVWEYNSVNNTWKSKGNYPLVLAGAVGFAIGKNGYVGGGGNDYGTDYTNFYEYDTTGNTWTAITSLPYAGTDGLAGSVEFVIGDHGFVGTGMNNGGVTTREFWSYDTTAKSWTSIANISGVSRYNASSFAIGNYGYVFGGVDSLNAGIGDLWQYGPKATGIEEVKSSVKITLYPNPGNGMMTLLYNGNIQQGELQITDLMGKIVDSYELAGSAGKMSINETSLSNGMYFYQLVDSGKLISSGKFIIAK